MFPVEFGRLPLQNLGDAHVAQLVEHFLGKEEVTGSIPVVGSSFRSLRELQLASDL